MLAINLLHICTLVCPVAWCKEVSIKALMYQKGCLFTWNARTLLVKIVGRHCIALKDEAFPYWTFLGREGRILINVEFRFRCKVLFTPWTRHCFHRSTFKWSFCRFPFLKERKNTITHSLSFCTDNWMKFIFQKRLTWYRQVLKWFFKVLMQLDFKIYDSSSFAAIDRDRNITNFGPIAFPLNVYIVFINKLLKPITTKA